MDNVQTARLALIAYLAEQWPTGRMGRTALMKSSYFLQTVRQVPLGYRFTLYSYGPFDSDVLADLDSAEVLGAVRSNVVYYPGGYGYEIQPAAHAEHVKAWAAAFLNRHREDIDWVLSELGNLGSAELELVSTMVYVDREARRASETPSFDELLRRVRDIKPRFPELQVRRHAESLARKGLLQAVPSVGDTRIQRAAIGPSD